MWVPSNNQTILLFRISIPRGRSMCTVVWRCLEGALEETSSLCSSPTSAVLSSSRSSRFSHLSSPGGLLWWAQWPCLRSCCSTLCFGLVATISVEFLFPAPTQLQSRERTGVPRVELANTLRSSPHFCSRPSQVRFVHICTVWTLCVTWLTNILLHPGQHSGTIDSGTGSRTNSIRSFNPSLR